MKPSRFFGAIVARACLAYAAIRSVPLGTREAAEGPSEPIDPTTRFEPSDLHARAVFLAGVGVLAGTWLIIALVYPYFVYLKHQRAAASPPPTAAARTESPVPPEPRIQANPVRDLEGFRAWEESQLHDYHWVDRNRGIVSIPIEVAIRIVARRGIPAQPAPDGHTYFDPREGTRRTGFEGKVEVEPR